jgi:hypothetical protein
MTRLETPRVGRPRAACVFALGALACLAPAGAADAAAPATECAADVDALAPYMMTNDAGAKDEVARKGRAVFDDALATARAQAAKVSSDGECLAVLRAYLQTFRRTHLNVRDLDPQGGSPARQPPGPAFRVLSPTTALLTIPSFADPAGSAIAALVKSSLPQIAARSNLIVDVRGNDGGSDWTYAPVLALAVANPWRNFGTQLLATPANSAATRAICPLYAPQSTQCRDAARAASEAMDLAAAGTFIPSPGEQQSLTIEKPGQVLRQPRRIGVLVDRRCASSCEEFLLAMRQSFKVKLFGQSSAGSLDYSNLRPWTLPSGKRRLMYATSRSTRLPDFAVDAAGIPPDQVLATPANADERERQLADVQQVLESAR